MCSPYNSTKGMFCMFWNCAGSVGASDSENMESPQFEVIDDKSALCMQSQLQIKKYCCQSTLLGTILDNLC